jgi:hypothetical protein
MWALGWSRCVGHGVRSRRQCQGRFFTIMRLTADGVKYDLRPSVNEGSNHWQTLGYDR